MSLRQVFIDSTRFWTLVDSLKKSSLIVFVIVPFPWHRAFENPPKIGFSSANKTTAI
jgi:hypothetical protein